MPRKLLSSLSLGIEFDGNSNIMTISILKIAEKIKFGSHLN